jgi:cell division protein ZapB
MEEELDSLEQKINQLAELCQQLRADNQKLRQQLAASLAQSRALHEKIGGARTRLEALLERVPESQA